MGRWLIVAVLLAVLVILGGYVLSTVSQPTQVAAQEEKPLYVSEPVSCTVRYSEYRDTSGLELNQVLVKSDEVTLLDGEAWGGIWQDMELFNGWTAPTEETQATCHTELIRQFDPFTVSMRYANWLVIEINGVLSGRTILNWSD